MMLKAHLRMKEVASSLSGGDAHGAGLQFGEFGGGVN